MVPPPRLTPVPRAADDSDPDSNDAASDDSDAARGAAARKEPVSQGPAAELQRAVRAKLAEDRGADRPQAAGEAEAAAVAAKGADEAVLPTESEAGTESDTATDAETGNVREPTPSSARLEALRILEAVLFAASEPLDEKRLEEALGRKRLDEALGAVSETDAGKTETPRVPGAKRTAPASEAARGVGVLLAELQRAYAPRGVNLVRVAGKWAFRTAQDLSYLLERHASEERKLSKAALETMAIIAYHQPVTRAEIEEIRGVSTSAGTLDILLETGWVRPRGRRRAPGRPVTYGTTDLFLGHFGLDTIKDLPGLSELKGAGLLDNNLPPGFTVPEPCDVAALMPDELPLDTPDEDEAQAEMDLETPDSDEPTPPEA